MKIYICRAHSTYLFICNNSLYDTLLEVDETKYAVDTFGIKNIEYVYYFHF